MQQNITTETTSQPDSDNRNLLNLQKKPILISLAILILLIAIGSYFIGRNSTGSAKKESAESEQVGIPITNISPTETTQQIPLAVTDSNNKTYTSEKGFSLTYPNTWNLRTMTVLMGETLQEGPHEYQIEDIHGNKKTETVYEIDINAEKADVEYLILSKKDSWQVHISAETAQVNTCEYQVSMLADAFKTEPWKELNHPNYTLLRRHFEDGWIDTAPGPAGSESIPRSQIIMNKREELSGGTSLIILDGCLMRENPPVVVRISYYSPFFTKQNFPEGMMGNLSPDFIDEGILSEMDEIVNTFTF